MNRKSSFSSFAFLKSNTSHPEKPVPEVVSHSRPKLVKENAPDKGWRKKITGNRPKTPSNLTVAVDDVTRNDAPAQQLRPHQVPYSAGWETTIHESRSPTLASTSIPVHDSDNADEKSSETSHRKGASRPNFSRYLSSYLTLTVPHKNPNFSEPWNEDTPPVCIPSIDPLVALLSIHNHISSSPALPIPVQHHSGLLRIFEDYRKTRSQNESLDDLLKETLQGYKTAEDTWASTEDRYRAEIRRLELHIAHGASGLSELIRARKGSIIRRQGTHKDVSSVRSPETAYKFMSEGKLKEQIVLESSNVLLHNPSSPSRDMVAMSRKFSSTTSLGELESGPPPSAGRQLALTQAVKGELDLVNMANLSSSNSAGQSSSSAFSSPGDQLPDEIAPLLTATKTAEFGMDAVKPLQDIASLGACRQSDEFANPEQEQSALSIYRGTSIDEYTASLTTTNSQEATESPWTLRTQSRKRFSFELGQDLLHEKEPANIQMNSGNSKSSSRAQCFTQIHGYADSSSSSESGTFVDSQDDALQPRPNVSTQLGDSVQDTILRSDRQAHTVASLKAVKPLVEYERRRDSGSSVLTAIRHVSSGSLRLHSASTSRCTSTNDLRELQDPLSDGTAGVLPLRNNAIAVAAAKAANKGSLGSKSSSVSRNSMRQSSSGGRPTRTAISRKGPRGNSEDDAPCNDHEL